MSDKWDQRMTLMIECSVSIYLYSLLTLTDYMGENLLRIELGWVLVILTGAIAGINVSLFLWRCYLKALRFIKEKLGCIDNKARKGV